MTKTIVIDIDGTIADCAHRLHHIQKHPKDWKTFFAESANDKPFTAVVEIVNRFLRTHDIVFCTGRGEEHRKMTVDWLVMNSGLKRFDFDVRMRRLNDHRPDDVVKEEMLQQLRVEGRDILFVIDDRQKVVDMWRRNGLICLQMAPNEADNMFIPSQAGKNLLYLMVGPSGAGKSMWCEQNTLQSERLSSDDFREHFSGSLLEQGQNELVFAAIADIAAARLKYGFPIAIDATHLHKRDRLKHVALAPARSVVTYVVIDRPLEQKIRDGGWRNGINIKGKTLIEHHHNIFQQNLPDILAGDGLSNVRVVDYRQTS